MRRSIVLIAFLLVAVCFVTGQEDYREITVSPGEGEETPERDTINPDEPRELLVFQQSGFIFGAYIRIGLNMNTQAHMIGGVGYFDVENSFSGMRFMNEGNYSEWLFAYESPRDDPKWWGGVYMRMAYDLPEFYAGWQPVDPDNDPYNFVLPEAYFRLGYGSGWNLWLGRRYNDKIAINMMDYYVANLDGNGIGIENLSIGPATLDFHWLFSYDLVAIIEDEGSSQSHPGKMTWALVPKRIPVPGGSLSFILAPSYQSGGFDMTSSTTLAAGAGAFFAAKYLLTTFFGAPGETEIFASVGFGTGANQHVDTSLGNYTVGDWSALAGYQGYAVLNDVVSWRNTLYYEHRGFSDLSLWNGESDFLSFGFRPFFKQTPIFGWQLEYDLEVSIRTGKMVNRITLAPTFVPPGGDTTSALQVMPYVSYAYGDFVGGDVVAVSPGSRHGLTWGFFGNVGF